MASSVVVGSTGLVGSYILSTLLQLPAFNAVHTLTRRAPKGSDAKLNAIIEDSAKWTASLSTITPPPDIFFSGLGTTRGAAGGFDNQRKIDYDLNLELARAAKKAGVKVYVLISSGGADPKSRMAYLKMKGELEEAVQALDFEKTVILRPGFLLGGREDSRPAETAAQYVTKFLGAVSGNWLTDGWALDANAIGKAAVSGGLKALSGEGPKLWIMAQSEIIKLGRTEWKAEQQK